MYRSRRCQLRRRAFTLIEVLITLVLLGVLAALTGGLYIKSRANARALRCLSNQQQISCALLSYYTDTARFPTDDPDTDLALQLEKYISWTAASRDISLPDVWRCPNDRSGPLSNSYQDYYVPRRQPTGPDYFLLGCPRHNDTGNAYINVHGISHLRRARSGRILVNGQAVNPEAPPEDRTINDGVLTFEDGSTATITSTAPEYGVTAVASFRNDDGAVYTIVRVSGHGHTNFSVTPGSRFEVITPVAIIGVRGTHFGVSMHSDYVRISLQYGQLEVWDRVTGKTHTLASPAYLQLNAADPTGEHAGPP